MKLFLSGGSKRAFVLDKKFMEMVDKSKLMLYIPIAINTKKHAYSECFEWIKKYFSEFNFSNIKMITNLKGIKKSDLNKFGSVYIGGGNTPYLLKELKESGFYEHLKYLIDKDIPLAGGSAGAIIFGNTIIPSLIADENKVGLKDFNALNKIQGYDLDAHYESSMDKEIRRYMKEHNLKKVIALPEYCGIYVHNKKMTILGEHSAFIFDSRGKREIKNGKMLK
jgi:dipeptidase E